MRSLFWFRQDLRVNDNPGLLAQKDAAQLLLVYLWPKERPWCNVNGIGKQRRRFLLESLQALRDELKELGQDLMVLQGSPEMVIPDLVRDYAIDRVDTGNASGHYERQALEVLQKRLTVPITVHNNTTLFAQLQLPFSTADLPVHFTPFRRLVEHTHYRSPAPYPDKLPRKPAAPFDVIPRAEIHPHTALPIRGGSLPARRRLNQFIFEEQGIARYKQTRNCLDPLSGSSTLSPWLANGCLSPSEVAAAIHRFEEDHGANESTAWLYLELLWREYFYWRAVRDDVSLFRSGFHHDSLRYCTFEPRNFARWCAGDTDYPLVNAIMHQLVETGWASNRGRQIAASCFINELRLDWRHGAAFFEKHLIDYAVASNYGNWQYIAGLGADPRGGRHFDLQKQTREYDPDGTFTVKWDGHRPKQPIYVKDPADWPIT